MSSRALARAEALQLLGSVALGRIAFTLGALPAIRPANHILDQGAVVLRGHRGVDAVLRAAAGTVVAYSADVIDPRAYVGWCVTVTGEAEMIDGPTELARYASIVRPIGADEQAYVIRIEPEIVTGFELLQRPQELAASPV